MSEEPDDRTVAERQLEQAMDKLEKHHPQIAKRLRTMWHKERVAELGLQESAENMRAVAAAEREAQLKRDTPYADERWPEDTPDIANEGAVQPIGFWHRFLGGRGR
jgi:hypothetical protein